MSWYGGPKSWGRSILRYMSFKANRKPSPIFASYFVTYRCNLRCEFCFIYNNKYPELDEEGARTVVNKICDSGVPTLDFSGGEPFLRKDIESLGALAMSRGCVAGVNTNGTMIDEKRASSASSSFNYITVSIDGPEEVHDRIRGVKGTYARAKNALRLLNDHGANVGISSVVEPTNAGYIVKALDDLRGMFNYVIVQAVMPPKGPSNDGVAELIRRLKELKESGIRVLMPPQFINGIPEYLNGKAPKICDALSLYYAVSPTGDILACGARTDIIVGNILKDDPLKALSSPPEDALRKISSCPGCWIACTTGTSLAVKSPFNYVKWIALPSRLI